MNYCFITQQAIANGRYDGKALRKLNPKLTKLEPLQYDQEEQARIVKQQVGKISIDGVQPKFSVQLDLANESFKIVEKFGTYIIKPQNPDFVQLPENEAFTMLMAQYFGLETPLCGLLSCSDSTLSYFIKRFDRHGKNGKSMLEDFGQLAELNRETKYDYSIEKLIVLIDRFCTFPQAEKMKFLRLFCYNLLFGNEDMHLKNYSLLTDTKQGQTIDRFSPCYDLLNSMAALRYNGSPFNRIEQSALTLNGKKRNFKYQDLQYLCQRLSLPEALLQKCCKDLTKTFSKTVKMLENSFMSEEYKTLYLEVLEHNRPIFCD